MKITSIFFSFITLLILFDISSSQIIPNDYLNQNTYSLNQNNNYCQKITYETQFTQCQMTFQKCYLTETKLINCYKNQCERHIRGSECKLSVKIQLQQTQCYKQCCGSSQFSSLECKSYNKNRQKSSQISQGALIAILVFSSLFLLSILIFFLIKQQCCCRKQEDKRALLENKFIINWKQDQRLQTKCDYCNNFGAILQTPCKHFFHINCFQQNSVQKQFPECPKCKYQIRQRIKISCRNCKNKSFKVRLHKIQSLSAIIQQAQTLHTETCSSSLQQHTDEQLVVSSKK